MSRDARGELALTPDDGTPPRFLYRWLTHRGERWYDPAGDKLVIDAGAFRPAKRSWLRHGDFLYGVLRFEQGDGALRDPFEPLLRLYATTANKAIEHALVKLADSPARLTALAAARTPS